MNRFLFTKKFNGITLWPFIILREDRLKFDSVFMQHERIHLKQQLEMLIIPFYIWYGVEFIVRWLQYKERHLAYKNISFEREAYTNEKQINYVKTRKFWAFLKYTKSSL